MWEGEGDVFWGCEWEGECVGLEAKKHPFDMLLLSGFGVCFRLLIVQDQCCHPGGQTLDDCVRAWHQRLPRCMEK